MLKWLGGCAAVAIVVLAFAMWYGVRTIRESISPDGIERVAIAASPDRVYASLATGDSAATWMAQGNRVSSNTHGLFKPGDSILIQMRRSFRMGPEPMIWIVQRADSSRARVLELHSRSVKGPMATRYDSLVANGDSTTVLSTLTWNYNAGDSAKATGVTADLMLSMFRMQSKLELESLKARIEGRPLPAAR